MTVKAPAYKIPRATATIIVAAYDSLNKRADYVCDGVNDEVEIQAANNAANSGIVQLLDGHFYVTSLTIDNSTVAGQGVPDWNHIGTTITITGGITIKSGGNIQNVNLEAGAAYAGTMVTMGGTDCTMHGRADLLDGVRMVCLNASGGACLLLTVTPATKDAYIALCHFGAFSLMGSAAPMVVTAQDAAGHSGFISGNHFAGINIYGGTTNMLYIHPTASGSVCGNTIDSIQLQTQPVTVNGLVMDGTGAECFHNQVSHIVVWDFLVNACTGYEILLSPATSYNRIFGYMDAERVCYGNTKNFIGDTHFDAGKSLQIDCNDWVTTLVGSGSGVSVATSHPSYQSIHTGAGAGASAMVVSELAGLRPTGTAGEYGINWSVATRLTFYYVRITSGANVTGRLKLCAAAALGAMSDKGVGIKVANFNLYGISRGAGGAEVAVDLSTVLTNDWVYQIDIFVLPGKAVHWYCNCLLVGSTTVANDIPTSTSSGLYIVHEIENGAAGGSVYSFLQIPVLKQAIYAY